MRLAAKALTCLLIAFSCAFSASACPLVGGLIDYNCDGKHRISVTGDSIVFGTGDERNDNKGGYVSRIAKSLPSSEVFNFGYPGITTNRLLAHYKQLFSKSPNSDQVQQLGSSDIVIIDVGRNDYFNRNSSATTATTIKRLTVYLSSELEKRFGTAPLFVTTVLPLSRREIDLGFIKQVNMIILKIRGASYPAYLRFDKLNPLLLSSDGLHPTSAGYDVLGNIATSYIKKDAQTRSKRARPDSDSDGIYDLFERREFKTSPKNADTDGDSLKDGAEVFTYGTDPLKADTDGDGTDDATEIAQGTDPTVPGSAIATPTPTPS